MSAKPTQTDDGRTGLSKGEVRMCARCAGAFEFDPENYDRKPDTHHEVGETCPTQYRE
jgi:hypothetical protein